MELINSKIITFKAQNRNSLGGGISSLKASIRSVLECLHDQCVVVPIDKAAGSVVFVCKHFFIEVLIIELGVDPDCVTCNIVTYNAQGINDYLLINILSIFGKTSNLKLVRRVKFYKINTGSPSCTKIPQMLGFSWHLQLLCHLSPWLNQ